jgi:hypothetical protein
MAIHALELHGLRDGKVMYDANSIINNKWKLICLHSWANTDFTNQFWQLWLHNCKLNM